MTFFLYILPIILTFVLSLFYSKNVDRDESRAFVPRIVRWLAMLLSFIPVIGIFIFIGAFYICITSDTKFKQNKLTDFFINN